jgi:hypothetical protein
MGSAYLRHDEGGGAPLTLLLKIPLDVPLKRVANGSDGAD